MGNWEWNQVFHTAIVTPVSAEHCATALTCWGCSPACTRKETAAVCSQLFSFYKAWPVAPKGTNMFHSPLQATASMTEIYFSIPSFCSSLNRGRAVLPSVSLFRHSTGCPSCPRFSAAAALKHPQAISCRGSPSSSDLRNRCASNTCPPPKWKMKNKTHTARWSNTLMSPWGQLHSLANLIWLGTAALLSVLLSAPPSFLFQALLCTLFLFF